MNATAKLTEQASRLARALQRAAEQYPGDEANFRREAEVVLERLVNEHGVELNKRFERVLETRGRADAVFNRLIVEWEHPGALSHNETHPGNKHAVQQVQDYIDAIAHEDGFSKDRLAGVASDGRFIIFARYYANEWIVDAPVVVDEVSAEELLERIIAAQGGKALTAHNLLKDFGLGTLLTQQLARDLLDRLEEFLGHDPDGLAARLYTQWETYFAVATGVVGEAPSLKQDAREALARAFHHRPRDLHPAHALFALQTYFALITKLIALLALSLYVERVELDLEALARARDDDLHRLLGSVQRGEPFREAGFANIVEPDVFDWFLDWNGGIRDGVRQALDRLKDYDPTTLQVSPEDARDLLKDLYQGLLPRPVRHALGQYFTPDWLAERLLDGLEYQGDPELRLVDPACGTGTFLVLAIRRLKEELRRERLPEALQLRTVLRNVVGFDIDPLAAVAARTNYVLALGSLVRAAPGEPLDVPVYLADSIVMPAQKETLFTRDRLILPTSGHKDPFELPLCVNTESALRTVCDLAVEAIESDTSPEEFVVGAGDAVGADEGDRAVLAAFYEQCMELHDAGLDGLWVRVLRNAFMPAFVEEFDLVVGNPPWVNWESLPESYRQRTDELWRSYGLFVHGGMAAMLGAGKKDISMLMSYVVTDKLLKPSGRLGFVITQTVFKTAGAGQGFRRFRIGDHGEYVHVQEVDDMVDLKPFVGAANRTAVFIWKRGARTSYPVSYTLWQRTSPHGIRRASTLDSVLKTIRPLSLVAAPVDSRDPTSAWLSAPAELVEPLRRIAESGTPAYVAHAGVFAGANGIYWVQVDGPADPRGLVPVTNLHDIGRRRLPKRYGRVEAELVHPLIRGSDVQRWRAVPSLDILFVQDPETRRGIDEQTMGTRYPGALDFLAGFEIELRARAAFRRYYTRRQRGQVMDTGPYWSMFDVGRYTLAPHKVMWKDQASDFAAAVAPAGLPVPLPNHKVILIACDSEDEAHYLCGVLNSTPVRLFVAAYAVETQVSTHTVKYIHVPKFEPSNEVHTTIVQASRSAHQAVANGGQPEPGLVDQVTRPIWGLTTTEVDSMEQWFDRLRKRDLAVSHRGDAEDVGGSGDPDD